jgi:thymidylate synthase (FAD)
MKIIKQSWSFEDKINGPEILNKIERAGRTCYLSEPSGNAENFIKKIIRLGHESVLEHVSISVRIITDRGVTHELVRHRLASYSQESTRYCNYSKDRFDNEIKCILPTCFYNLDSDLLNKQFHAWFTACNTASDFYFDLLFSGQSPQQARSVLPNSLKTEIVMTANLREWRHFFKLRTAKAAHPQMRDLALSMLEGFKKELPVVFDDINPKDEV